MSRIVTRRQFVGGIAGGGAWLCWPRPSFGAAPAERTLFTEVNLVDGTGAPPRLANVLVSGGRIERITRPTKQGRDPAGRVIAGQGRVLAPGFIDIHSHADPLEQPLEGLLAMGVTTIVVGPDGSGPRIYFQQVPEGKVVKNRVHLDLNVGGGREATLDERRGRVDAEVERLSALGATTFRPGAVENGEYWVVMQDPEGNEFCVQ